MPRGFHGVRKRTNGCHRFGVAGVDPPPPLPRHLVVPGFRPGAMDCNKSGYAAVSWRWTPLYHAIGEKKYLQFIYFYQLRHKPNHFNTARVT